MTGDQAVGRGKSNAAGRDSSGGCENHFFEQIVNFNLARCRRCEKVIYRRLPETGVRKFF